jgi:hypothetical protein
MGGFPDHQGNLISGNQQVALSGGFCGGFWNSLFGSLGNPWVGYSKDFYPEFNVAYLKWKWTGIAKEERGL